MGEVGTLPAAAESFFSSKVKYFTTLPRYQPEKSPAEPPPSRLVAVEPSETMGQLTIAPEDPYGLPPGPVSQPSTTKPRIWNSWVSRER